MYTIYVYMSIYCTSFYKPDTKADLDSLTAWSPLAPEWCTKSVGRVSRAVAHDGASWCTCPATPGGAQARTAETTAWWVDLTDLGRHPGWCTFSVTICFLLVCVRVRVSVPTIQTERRFSCIDTVNAGVSASIYTFEVFSGSSCIAGLAVPVLS